MRHRIITLRSARLQLRAVPSNGGAILDLTTALSRPLLEGPGGSDGPPQGMGCFPMTPFCGRLPGKTIVRDNGGAITLPDNLREGGVAHGVGWLRPWTVAALTETSLVMEFEHSRDDPDWPWQFGCRQIIRLRGPVARISLVTRNRDSDPMPCASGLHPYLTLGPSDDVLIDGAPIPGLSPGAGRLASASLIEVRSGADRMVLTSSCDQWALYQPLDRAALCCEPFNESFDLPPRSFLDPGAAQIVELEFRVQLDE